MEDGRARPRVVSLALVALGVWLAGAELHNTVAPSLLDGSIYARGVGDGVMVLAALLTALRGLTGPRRERAPWLLFGAGMLAWATGDIYWTAVLFNADPIPIPSWADAGYLAFCPLVFAGTVMLVRARVRDVPRTLWVDGVSAALAIGALSAAVVVQAVLGAVGGGVMAVATNLAYPVFDLVLLGVIVGALALNGWRVERAWLTLAAGVVTFWLADSLYLITNAQGTYEAGGFFDPWWYAAGVIMAAAAWQPVAAQGAVSERRQSVRAILIPLGFALSGLGVLVAAALAHLNLLAVGLAGLSLVVTLARLAMTFRENVTMLEHSRREALTDALTGLGNRRRLHDDLDALLPAAHDGAPLVLVLFDLDGFKHYNDTFGHPAGDALLSRLGRNLEAYLTGRGRAYRMGGDEFCALIAPGPEVAQLMITAAAAALAEHGEGFSIGCSYGSIVLPREAQDPESALRIADQRMYANKHGGRTSASRQSRAVLLRALSECNAQLGAHLEGVGELAEAVALRCALPPEEVEQIRHAAELHDVGKMAIPDAILEKPGPLDDAEWAFVRRHTLIGERIISAAPALMPVAALVRSTHEHFDGSGYPDGLAGQEIPLGARIIAVCDAFDAMTADRPYRAATTPARALAELRRHAGSKFDPMAVEAFCAVCAQRTGDRDQARVA